MLRKRIIFTLLYSNGSFVLSRNFRLQKVGNIQWLENHYDFNKIAQFIDELVILNVSREDKGYLEFTEVVEKISNTCFIPVAAGGGIDSVNKAKELINHGADKVVINTHLTDNELMRDLSSIFGKQSIIGSIDVESYTDKSCVVVTGNGQDKSDMTFEDLVSRLNSLPIGEVYLNSITNDGTGIGLDFDLLNKIGSRIDLPLIFAGGVGNKIHLTEGLQNPHVNAVSTAHLFNFIGDALELSRIFAVDSGINLASWRTYEFIESIRYIS